LFATQAVSQGDAGRTIRQPEVRREHMAELSPWGRLEELSREMDHLMAAFNRGTEPFAQVAFLPGRGARQYPLVNLCEGRDAIKIEALAPGVEPDQLEVSVVRDSLTISGEKRRLMGDIQADAFHRRERATGKFARTIKLPTEVDTDNISADYTNGLLVITLPKAERAKPKQIAVKVD
jgi:HSP20 family protein